MVDGLRFKTASIQARARPADDKTRAIRIGMGGLSPSARSFSQAIDKFDIRINNIASVNAVSAYLKLSAY